MPFEMIQGSIEPPLRLTLTDNGSPVALSQADAVKLRAVQYDLVVFEETIAAEFADDGVVERAWEAGDTEIPGRLWIEACVTWPGNRAQWFRPADVVDVVQL